jgi:dihydrofolate reductase
MNGPIVLIAAVAKNGVIGRNGDLPWKLSGDLKHFRRLTLGKPVVMGRKTFASIGRPLAGRTTIVVTRDPHFTATGVVVAADLKAALTLAEGDRLRRGADATMIAGGADLYAQTLPLATRLEITEVDATVAGDTSFPDIDPALFVEATRQRAEPGPGDDHAYSFVSWVRR